METDQTVETMSDDGSVTVEQESAVTADTESETQTTEQTVEEELDPKTKEGFIKARQAEKEKARQAEERARLAEENLQRVLAQVQPQKVEEEYDPDMPMTIGEWEKLQKKEKAEQARKEQERTIVNSARKAKEKYKDAEFTYEDALQYAKENFSEKRMLAILQSDNPAEDLYNLVLIQPEISKNYKENIQKETVKKTVETLNKHLNQTGTLSKAGTSDSAIDQVKKWEQMSYSDIIKEQDKIIASR